MDNDRFWTPSPPPGRFYNTALGMIWEGISDIEHGRYAGGFALTTPEIYQHTARTRFLFWNHPPPGALPL